eukprot:m.92959 g.92959  ORF g.92959 m.92959 type:complete len:418 (-) comp26588_c0_seq3:266-1519(-)
MIILHFATQLVLLLKEKLVNAVDAVPNRPLEALAAQSRPLGVRVSSFVVTGGFFDNSSNGFIATLRLRWQNTEDGVEVLDEMAFDHPPQIVVPPNACSLHVKNKGLAGSSWYNGELWACFPNTIVAFSQPTASMRLWKQVRVIDNDYFNDLHHLSVGPKGLVVANTGLETIDVVSFEGVLLHRISLIPQDLTQLRLTSSRTSGEDFRIHNTKIPIPHQKHVNHITLLPSSKDEINILVTCFGNPEAEARGILKRVNLKCAVDKDPGGKEAFVATHEHIIATIDGYPHDGEVLPATDEAWVTTVIGDVLAMNLLTGQETTGSRIRLYDRHDCAHGWTRGLCVLPSGVLVGSTAIDPKSKGATYPGIPWPWDVAITTTAITFVPTSTAERATIVNLDFPKSSQQARSKIFSVLAIPEPS